MTLFLLLVFPPLFSALTLTPAEIGVLTSSGDVRSSRTMLTAIDAAFQPVATVLVPLNTSAFVIYLRETFPPGVLFFALLIASDGNSLQTVIQPPAAVGAASILGMQATVFSDRLLLQSNTSLATHFSPCTWSPDVSNQSRSSTTVNCTVPHAIAGTLWRLALGWAAPFDNTQELAVLAPLREFGYMTASGAPLSLTFPLPRINDTSPRHFKTDSNNLRSVPSDFAGDPSKTSASEVPDTA